MRSTIKYIFCTILFITITTVANALEPAKWNSRYQAYIDKYKDIAIKEMLTYNIPASITLAQGILESGAGESELARKGNNHFGIKCHGWTGRTTYHDDDERQECFRAYDNVLDSYEDHSKFLASGQRYRQLFSLSNRDYKGWARGLKAAGYATNPQYAQLLIDIIECYQLYTFDCASTYDEANISGKHPLPQHTPVNTLSQPTSTIHVINKNNGCFYVLAKQGDTFDTIGNEFDIKGKKLAKYNERDRKDILAQGEIIYLHYKRTKADKSFKKKPHIVRSGESLYSISQMYGVRLKNLYKKNHFAPDHKIKVGDTVKVY